MGNNRKRAVSDIPSMRTISGSNSKYSPQATDRIDIDVQGLYSALYNVDNQINNFQAAGANLGKVDFSKVPKVNGSDVLDRSRCLNGALGINGSNNVLSNLYNGLYNQVEKLSNMNKDVYPLGADEFLNLCDLAVNNNDEFGSALEEFDGEKELYDLDTKEGRACYIYDSLTQKYGLTKWGALAVMAHMYGTNDTFDPKRYQGDNPDNPGYGLCQWEWKRPGRDGCGSADEMKAWCDENGYEFDSIDGQLAWLNHYIPIKEQDFLHDTERYIDLKAELRDQEISDQISERIEYRPKFYELVQHFGDVHQGMQNSDTKNSGRATRALEKVVPIVEHKEDYQKNPELVPLSPGANSSSKVEQLINNAVSNSNPNTVTPNQTKGNQTESVDLTGEAITPSTSNNHENASTPIGGTKVSQLIGDKKMTNLVPPRNLTMSAPTDNQPESESSKSHTPSAADPGSLHSQMAKDAENFKNEKVTPFERPVRSETPSEPHTPSTADPGSLHSQIEKDAKNITNEKITPFERPNNIKLSSETEEMPPVFLDEVDDNFNDVSRETMPVLTKDDKIPVTPVKENEGIEVLNNNTLNQMHTPSTSDPGSLHSQMAKDAENFKNEKVTPFERPNNIKLSSETEEVPPVFLDEGDESFNDVSRETMPVLTKDDKIPVTPVKENEGIEVLNNDNSSNQIHTPSKSDPGSLHSQMAKDAENFKNEKVTPFERPVKSETPSESLKPLASSTPETLDDNSLHAQIEKDNQNITDEKITPFDRPVKSETPTSEVRETSKDSDTSAYYQMEKDRNNTTNEKIVEANESTEPENNVQPQDNTPKSYEPNIPQSGIIESSPNNNTSNIPIYFNNNFTNELNEDIINYMKNNKLSGYVCNNCKFVYLGFEKLEICPSCNGTSTFIEIEL